MNTLTINSQVLGNIRTKILDVDVTALIVKTLTISAKGADSDWEIYFDKNISELIPPNQPSLSATTTGGNLLRSTKVFVRITAVDSLGNESPPSLGGKNITTGSSTDTNKITSSWSSVPGASSYNIYAGTRVGMETYLGNTSNTSYIITDLLDNTTNNIASSPDIVIYGKKLGSEAIYINNLYIQSRLIVYVTPTANSEVGFSCLAE